MIPPELRADDFCVNAIAPRLDQCQTTEHVFTERHILHKNRRALQRAQYPADIDSIVIYQLSALSDFVSGQNLPVKDDLVFN